MVAEKLEFIFIFAPFECIDIKKNNNRLMNLSLSQPGSRRDGEQR